MRHSIAIILILALNIVSPCHARSNDKLPTAPAAELEIKELHLVYLFEGKQTDFIFRIGDSGFRTVESLKQHIETWPAGTELRWRPGCERFGNDPLLSSEKDMEEFKKFLKQRGIKFTFIPSG